MKNCPNNLFTILAVEFVLVNQEIQYKFICYI